MDVGLADILKYAWLVFLWIFKLLWDEIKLGKKSAKIAANALRRDLDSLNEKHNELCLKIAEGRYNEALEDIKSIKDTVVKMAEKND